MRFDMLVVRNVFLYHQLIEIPHLPAFTAVAAGRFGMTIQFLWV